MDRITNNLHDIIRCMNAKEAKNLASRFQQDSRTLKVARQKRLLIDAIKFEAGLGNFGLITNEDLYAENLKWLTEKEYKFRRAIIHGRKEYNISWE